MVFLCGEIKDLVSEADKHCVYHEDPDDIDLNMEFQGLKEDEVKDMKLRYVLSSCHCSFCFGWLTITTSWECSYNAIKELNQLVPNFLKKIDKGTPEELNTFYREVSNCIFSVGIFTY